MTPSPRGEAPGKPPRGSLRLVLTGVVGAQGVPLPPAALALASQLNVPLRALPTDVDPAAALASLQGEAGPWLVPLTVDPGAWLGAAGRWSELLGAFRQPTLLLVDQAAVPGGGAAATMALLEGAGVPMAGLIQWGGPWEPQVRRAEGLPWLGWMGGEAPGGEPTTLDPGLVSSLLLRWRGLDQGAGQSGVEASRLS